MRKEFIEELCAAREAGLDVVLITGDIGWGLIEPFADKYPDSFINAGIAEQNMMGMAAGIASEGAHVFVYSIANFPTFRCAEQIRNDVDYHQFPVTIVSSGGGLGYGSLGYSHHAIQDYALMRSFPNMLIASPCDAMETRACLRYLLEHPRPSYLRLGRGSEKLIHKDIPTVKPGEWIKITEGPTQYLTTGTAAEFAGSGHCTLPMWGMKYKKQQLEYLAELDHLTVIEEHLTDGGFGSWILEAASTLDAKIELRGINPDNCHLVGSREFLLAASGLVPNSANRAVGACDQL
jgi:transketolase